MDWQLSEEAQHQSVSQGYFPIFDGVAPPEGYPQVSSLRIMSGDLRDILAKDEENKKRFTDLFGGELTCGVMLARRASGYVRHRINHDARG